MLKSKEFYEIMNQFEKDAGYYDFTKESKSLWEKQIYYCNGQVNNLFRFYLLGYQNAKNLFR